MHFSTLALTLLSTTLPPILAAAFSPTSPSTSPTLLFARQAELQSDKSCRGPIVNLYTYPSTNCRNTLEGSTPAEQNSPIRNVLKFAPFNENILDRRNYESACRNLEDPAKSLAFDVDGSKTEYCKLLVYVKENCAGDVGKSFNLNGRNLDGDGIGDCQVRAFRSAKVVCSKSVKNTPEV